MPTRMNADPNKRYRVSFIAAYSLVPTPVSRYAHAKIPRGRTSPLEPERRHQRDLLVELEAGAAGERRLAVVRPVEPEGERGRDPGADGGDEPHRERTAARREHDQQRADERRPRDDRQDREAHG